MPLIRLCPPVTVVGKTLRTGISPRFDVVIAAQQRRLTIPGVVRMIREKPSDASRTIVDAQLLLSPSRRLDFKETI